MAVKANSVLETDYNDVVYDSNDDIVIKVTENIQNVTNDDLSNNTSILNESDKKASVLYEDSDEYDTREEEVEEEDSDEDSHEDSDESFEGIDSDSDEQLSTPQTTTTKKTTRSIMSFFNRVNKSFSAFFKRIFQNKTLLGCVILALASSILVGIIILVFCVNRCSRKSGKEGFTIYYDEYDEDADDEYNVAENSDDVDVIERKQAAESAETYAKVNLASMIVNKLKENSFGYAKLDETNRCSKVDAANKFLYVKCDANNSFDSGISYLADETTAQQVSTSENAAMNIKTNPFSLI